MLSEAGGLQVMLSTLQLISVGSTGQSQPCSLPRSHGATGSSSCTKEAPVALG